jgi:SHS2 domain-containing protein
MGFKEIRHTADRALLVWGKDIETLFKEAGLGMYSLLALHSEPSPMVTRVFSASGADFESLLVMFLSELLFYLEQEDLVFTTFDLQFHTGELKATMRGSTVNRSVKMIKAVTFHNLDITKLHHGFQVEIVFDV